MSDFQILWVNPLPTPKQRCNQLENINFRLCVRTKYNLEASEFAVRLWTNLFHKENNEGEWHVVNMPYLGVSVRSDSGSVDHLYGVDLFITCPGSYGFNYRALCKRNKKSEKSDSSGKMAVIGPLRCPLTEWIQYPEEFQITSNIWLGNHAAALNAPIMGYDCLINCANDAPVHVLQLNRPILLKKFAVQRTAMNVIKDRMVFAAVRWLWESSLRCKKILVFSKYYVSRAASIIIAYIYAKNRDLTFDEAYKFVESRATAVFYHKGLKETLARLYPRG